MLASKATLRNLLSSSTPFMRHQDTPGLDIVKVKAIVRCLPEPYGLVKLGHSFKEL